jgi:hypothetical protein
LTQKVPWLRVFIEGVVILGSILLAFGIEAWWSERQDAGEELRLLSAVHEDMQANLAQVAENAAYHTAAEAAERQILTLAGADPATLSLQAVDTLLADILWWQGSQHWQTGALDALTLGGKIDIIRNEELRHTLASWIRRIELVRSAEDQEEDFFVNALIPYLRREASVTQIAELAQFMPGTDIAPGYGRVNWAQEQRDHRPMVASTELQNLVLQKLWIQVDILYRYDAFSTQLTDLIGVIEAELEGRGS